LPSHPLCFAQSVFLCSAMVAACFGFPLVEYTFDRILQPACPTAKPPLPLLLFLDSCLRAGALLWSPGLQAVDEDVRFADTLWGTRKKSPFRSFPFSTAICDIFLVHSCELGRCAEHFQRAQVVVHFSFVPIYPMSGFASSIVRRHASACGNSSSE